MLQQFLNDPVQHAYCIRLLQKFLDILSTDLGEGVEEAFFKWAVGDSEQEQEIVDKNNDAAANNRKRRANGEEETEQNPAKKLKREDNEDSEDSEDSEHSEDSEDSDANQLRLALMLIPDMLTS